MSYRSIGCLLLATVIGGSFNAQGEPAALMGADSLIGKIRQELSGETAPKPGEDPARAAYQKDLAFFRTNSASLLPAGQAADAWLALADRFWKLPPPPVSGNFYSYSSSNSKKADPLSFQGLLAAIPGPDSWPLIQARLGAAQASSNATSEARARDAILEAAFAYLNKDPARLRAALDYLGKQTGSLNRYSRENFRDVLRTLEEQAQALEGQSEDPVTKYEKEFRKTTEKGESRMQVRMPDLVSLAGPEKSESLIRKALAVPSLRIDITGEATSALARKLALEQVKSLPSPHWKLVDPSPDGVALYEGLLAQFGAPQKEEDDAEPSNLSKAASSDPVRRWNGYEFLRDFETARLAYLIGLLRLNRGEEALKEALKFKEEDFSGYSFESAWKHQTQTAPVPVLSVFLGRVLEARPELPFWKSYLELSAIAGQSDQALALLDKTAARPDLNAAQRFGSSLGRAVALLALDRIDEAVAIWRGLAAITATNEMPSVQCQLEEKKMSLGREWAQLGATLERNDWFDEGVALHERAQLRLTELKSSEQGMSYYSDPGFCEDFLKLKRYADGEQWVLKSIQTAIGKAKTTQSGNPAEPIDLSDQLGSLVTIYDKSGRPADVLALFENAPWWGSATNLTDLSSEPFYVPAARALHAAGRNDEAWQVLQSALAARPGDDNAYAVLIDIPGHDIPAFLDRLYARDRFEERPLIWKAVLLLKAGRLDEAETVARQALKVDPTDGEEPDGDRVRGYAVLADVLDAKGKKDDAEFFRKVVKSVRIAEEGDRMKESHLSARSLKLYAEAETYFADAYCIQWRLAERLQASGHAEEARKHYQIAFERMPEQFGQVASLCFGCMGVFENQQSRGAAEIVLSRLATNTPVRPAVFYLLGQLREEQQRYRDAYDVYQKAVALDPDYLDVWEKLYGLMDHVVLPASDWNAIQLRLMRMDPLQRHISIRQERMTDMKALWNVLSEAQKLALPNEMNLPLRAALEAASKTVETADPFSSTRRFSRYSTYSRGESQPVQPGEFIARNPFMTGLCSIQAALNLSRNQNQINFF